MTVNNDGKTSLENNHDFLDHFRMVPKSSGKVDVTNIADGFLWRLSREDAKKESHYQYDLMISCTHNDKDVCHPIPKAPINDDYRVGIDLEHMDGIIMEAIADAT